ncbi:MAG TPA: vitamin K epoxide reductase family protein [Marmoricola sp.]|nr:vitamin K epoxide reductase family protein [Marmoricola sp.]
MSSRTSAEAAERSLTWPPGWVRPVALVLAVLGVLVSAYLTYEHFTGSRSLACSENSVVDCSAVTKSFYNQLPPGPGAGVPVAVLGLAFFVVVLVLCLPMMWGRSRGLDLLRLVVLGGGVLMVLWLVYAELFKIDRICLWCTAVHVITVVLFGVVAVAEALRPLPTRR